ncbi:CLUMA_CG016956, isoform A [Clunio marinus]|uniref:CLUMA_CG016956, isoform A n=1 Tax=Clunio marinus TaxID=568069 RepID=A0A1J1IUG9_9DIPT|nr:CLUMA_CG016956, isoform A [Clunio marinus]
MFIYWFPLNLYLKLRGAIEDQLTTQHQSIPRQIELKIVTNEVCYEDEFMASLISSRTFCAIGENGSGPCKGDSGGGLYMKDNSKWFIKGIVSSSLFTDEGMCDVESYSVFTDVTKFTDWIDGEIEDEIGIEAEDGMDDIGKTDGSTMKCEFVLESGWRYHCYPKNLLIQHPNVKIKTMVGTHLGRRNNNDVREFSGINQQTSFLPLGISELFPNLRRYCYLSGRLESIQRSDFGGFELLEIIDIGFNKISNIPVDTFYDLPKLIEINVRNSRVTSLDVDLFINNPKLEKIILENNDIEILDGRLFRKNINLKEILMKNNELKSIDLELFTPLKKLTAIDFLDNVCISQHFPKSMNLTTLEERIKRNCSYE